MLGLLLALFTYGSYVSSIKFLVFLFLFILWLPLVAWTYRDAKAVGTREVFWAGVLFATGAVAILVWLLIPSFAVGIVFYLIAVGAMGLAYVMHRNARVADFERVLTGSHLKGLFSNEQKRLAAVSKGIVFITANGNEVGLPAPKTPEFYGYKVATQILDDAIWRRASDVSFLPAPAEYGVLYRIDGLVFKQPSRAREEVEYFIRFTKHLADLEVEERRKPQKGRFTVARDSARTNWELNTAGSTTGERVQIKQLEKYKLMTLGDIGLSAEQLEPFGKIRDTKAGVFLVSGPAKAGKTSTLYALLKNHDPYMFNLHTLERQPAAELMNITQNVYSLSDTGTTTFARRLQSVLRTDPDIVGVDDCQDAQTAQLVCQSAKTGKLIYVILEATSVMHALGRWLKWLADKERVAATLLGISNQRLVREICEQCKQGYQPNRELLKKFNIPADRASLFYRPAEVQYTKRGRPVVCDNCQGTGYVGRTGVFETMLLNDELRTAIIESGSLQEIATQFRRAGMVYLQEQAIRKVAHGITSINEVVRELSTAAGKAAKQPEQKT
jgi:type II secretory ATPase GspE/PulE/Tfp pilus assembly ATPase PilB-like protein